MRLLQNHFIRTDPAPSVSVGDGIRWHIDNAFLPSHEDPYRLDGGPREVYTRSIVALNTVETVGAALMVSPGSVGVKASLIISVLFQWNCRTTPFSLAIPSGNRDQMTGDTGGSAAAGGRAWRGRV